MSLSDDLAFALSLADAADTLTLAGLREKPRWSTKADGSPVCGVDIEVEDAMMRRIALDRPGDSVLGEESGRIALTVTKRSGGRQWVIASVDTQIRPLMDT